MKKTLALLLVGLPLALTLPGCISLAPKPPKNLLTITSTAQMKPGQDYDAGHAKTILIAVPSAPQSIATARIPVQTGATGLAYVKDALWIEQPARLFARMLSDTIGARTGRIVISSAQSYRDPGARLYGELRNFGVDADTREAVVTYDAALLRQQGQPLDKRRFEVRVPVGTIEANAVGATLNQAANQVAGQVADWVGS